eukprot:TRINITY_DN3937_c0_g1_i1.p1 TRINITY_DN3937_c0_g1~~TRINITY_DN3937_c0_g1_i1.p1  ORF type:complete len:235 (+),score=72.01 TRINITY_DN3937_c0_g1_i1:238-942(+)
MANEIKEHWISIASFGVGSLGVCCLYFGLYKYKDKIQLIQQTPLQSIEEISTQLSNEEKKQVYAKMVGRVDGDKWIESPISRKHVLMFKLRSIWNTSVQIESTSFYISQAEKKVSIDPKGAILYLEKTADNPTNVEHSLESGAQLFLIGEFSMQNNEKEKSQLVVRKPSKSNLLYIVSVEDELSIIKQFKTIQMGWTAVGSVFLFGSIAHFLFFGQKAIVPQWLFQFVSSTHPL